MGKRRVCVLVLGDVGRSPRMSYHSLSLAHNDFQVDLVAYKGNRPHESILNNPSIDLRLISEAPKWLNSLPTFMRYPLKAIWQMFYLMFILFLVPKPDYFLVQNPPSIPTLPVVWLVSCLRSTRYVIDWHNYGFTILALALGEEHYLVRLNEWIEGFFGKRASNNFCVTKALQTSLRRKWGISSTVLYDKPPAIFRPISTEEKHNLCMSLKPQYHIFNGADDNSTVITREVNGEYEMLAKRPALIVSSTSWTADEDFTMLVDSLKELDKLINGDVKLPKLICMITGKGPLKSYYEEIVSSIQWKNVTVLMPWLSAEEYPKLLATCDIGVSLHSSSSGLDLPMKVVDMFGCALPVCSYRYPCLRELVEEDVNGVTFGTSRELTEKLHSLLADFRESKSQLALFRQNLIDSFLSLRWDENWDERALPIFRDS